MLRFEAALFEQRDLLGERLRGVDFRPAKGIPALLRRLAGAGENFELEAERLLTFLTQCAQVGLIRHIVIFALAILSDLYAVLRELFRLRITVVQEVRKLDALALEQFDDAFDFRHTLEQLRQLLRLGRRQAFGRLKRDVFHAEFEQDLGQLGVAFDVLLTFPALDFVERRLRDEDAALFEQHRHLAVEEGQQQRADVRTIHIGIGHDDDTVIAQLADVEALAAEAGADRHDHHANFVVREHLVLTRLLNVQHLAAQRQHGLEAPVAALLG